jgi:hypothetical protein
MDELNIEQNEILTGCMLGDGNLVKLYGNQNSAFRVGHCEQQKEYNEWLCEKFKPFSLSITTEKRAKIDGFDKIRNTPIRSKTEFCNICVFRTKKHPIFRKLEQTWYARNVNGDYLLDKNKRRIKIVPNDISLTELSLAVWYFDDGTNLHNTNSKYKQRNAVLHTLAFTTQECNILTKEINKLGINCKVRINKEKPEIVILSCSYFNFIEMVKKYLPCKQLFYKVDLSNYKPPNKRHAAKVNNKTIRKTFRLLNNKVPQKEIAKILNLGEATISNIKNGKYNH